MDWIIVVFVFFIITIYFFRNGNTIFLSASETKKGVALINKYLNDFTYYQNLSPEGKSKFVKRIVSFISSKKFIGHHGLEVNGEMRVLVAASAVQLTFGLKKYILSHYHTIRLYPEAFYSRMLDAHLIGGTSEGGTISLSWADFKNGYNDPDDKYNLGLHEMAHALKLDLIKGYDFDQRFASYFDHWSEVALKTFQKMNSGNSTFLREYGATNMHEFFAVCIEHFFEVPEELKKEIPEIYYHLAYLLNQDPLNVKEDYRLTENLIEEANKNKIQISKNLQRTSKYDKWHWSYSLMLAGIFIGTGVIYVVRNVSLITISSIGLLIFIIGIISFAQWPYFKKNVQLLNFQQFALYCFFGSGLSATALLLALNYLIPVGDQFEEIKIKNYELYKSGGRAYVEVILYNNLYSDMNQIRTFKAEDARRKGIVNSNAIRYHFKKGLFGINTLHNYIFFSQEEENLVEQEFSFD